MDALRIDHSASAEEIFESSKEWMVTMGEWELIGITMKKYELPASDDKMYEELRFYVRKYYMLH